MATPLAPGRRRARGAQRRGQAFTGRREGVRGRGGGGAEAGRGSESVSDVGGTSTRESGSTHVECASERVGEGSARVRDSPEGGELSARRARPAQRLWIDAGCLDGVSGCGIDFAGAFASRAGGPPEPGPGTALKGWRGGALTAWNTLYAPPAGWRWRRSRSAELTLQRACSNRF